MITHHFAKQIPKGLIFTRKRAFVNHMIKALIIFLICGDFHHERLVELLQNVKICVSNNVKINHFAMFEKSVQRGNVHEGSEVEG